MQVLVTIEATAALLAVSPQSVRRMLKDGQLRPIRVRGSVRISLAELNAFIESQQHASA